MRFYFLIDFFVDSQKILEIIFGAFIEIILELSRGGDKLLYRVCAQTLFKHVAVFNDRPAHYSEQEFSIL